MTRDFTFSVYSSLIDELILSNYALKPVRNAYAYGCDSSKIIYLRHDVDRKPYKSLEFAEKLKEKKINATFYFRIVSTVFIPEIIEKIARMGHEIGYHYEDLPLGIKNEKLVIKKFWSKEYTEKTVCEVGIESFERNLKELRKYADIKTICMHGSPLSKWDSRLLWKYYDYRNFGIIGEPYFDIDFSQTLYLTDTGRRWNGSRFSIRDKLNTVNTEYHAVPLFFDWIVKPKLNSALNMTREAQKNQESYILKRTAHLISYAQQSSSFTSAMITFHPQRWHDSLLLWSIEWIAQKAKNYIKFLYNIVLKKYF